MGVVFFCSSIGLVRYWLRQGNDPVFLCQYTSTADILELNPHPDRGQSVHSQVDLNEMYSSRRASTAFAHAIETIPSPQILHPEVGLVLVNSRRCCEKLASMFFPHLKGYSYVCDHGCVEETSDRSQ